MKIGETIRKYRKEMGLTQEELANRLGVTTPAVNKWENGNSNPDIELLAPIARMLHITLDTLMSYHEELTEPEINNFIRELDALFQSESYETVYAKALELVQTYPNSNRLIWQAALLLDARRLTGYCKDPEKYDFQINAWYELALNDENPETRRHAADSLFGFYLRKKEYQKALEYLQYFSEHDPLKKLHHARWHREQGDSDNAYQLCEESLLSAYNTINLAFGQMISTAVENGNLIKSRYLAEKIGAIAKIFEMGTYYEYSPLLDVVRAEKNVPETLRVARQLLNSIDTLSYFCSSPLFEHMKFCDAKSSFAADLKEKLLLLFRDSSDFSYMQGNAEWKALIS